MYSRNPYPRILVPLGRIFSTPPSSIQSMAFFT